MNKIKTKYITRMMIGIVLGTLGIFIAMLGGGYLEMIHTFQTNDPGYNYSYAISMFSSLEAIGVILSIWMFTQTIWNGILIALHFIETEEEYIEEDEEENE